MPYPANEMLSELASAVFLAALLDPMMLVPTSYPDPSKLLFVMPYVDIRLGGDASFTGSTSQFTVPLKNPNSLITIGRSYGTEVVYVGGDPYKDCEVWIPFTTWTNTGSTDDTLERYLEFARDHRQNVFSAHGLSLIGGTIGSRPRQSSPVPGLNVVDYRWRFWYSRGS